MPIEAKNLTYIYGEGTPYEKKALNDINLEIMDGQFVGLIGHTGSGKSTLIQHFNALLAPTKGQLIFNNEDIHADKKKKRGIRQKIGLVFQYPEHQLFEMTIYRDVAFGPKNQGLPKEEVDKRVIEALRLVGLSKSDYEKSPFELSGGQKRRVAIAGVVAMEPDVLVLDEPTAGLDPKGREEILGQIRKLHEETGITVILVSHSMEDVARYVDRLIVMAAGEIRYDGTPQQVFRFIDELEDMGLAVPQVTYLARALRDKGISLPEDIINVEDAVHYIKEAILKKEGQ